VQRFNAASPILKKGLALTPVKFGISFNVVHFNQAGALVHVYTDGTVLVNHGGTEMGQGLNTKVAQMVAHELGMAWSVRVPPPPTPARWPTPPPPPPPPAATSTARPPRTPPGRSANGWPPSRCGTGAMSQGEHAPHSRHALCR
jgi:hypothetical protein